MKSNKLTLKSLRAELDLIKSSKAQSKTNSKPVTESHKSSVAHDIKNSYIQNLHMKSSMFTLWLVTGILSYASKIPFIKQILSLLSLYYGRTTVWKVIIKLRKIFILFNALIGVFMVFNTVGFSYDNILAGFVGMGYSYIEIFTNFTKRLFSWFVELFDYKVVPNIAGDNINPNNTYRKIWSNGPLDKSVFHPQNIVPNNVEDSLRNSYKSLFNISVEPSPSSLYKDLFFILTNDSLYFNRKLCIIISDVNPNNKLLIPMAQPLFINLNNINSVQELFNLIEWRTLAFNSDPNDHNDIVITIKIL